MNKPLFLFFFLIFTFFFIQPTIAQLGRALYAGATFSSFRNVTIPSTSGTGLEIGYFLFAKYSSRLEWNSSLSFLQIKRGDIPAYLRKSNSFFGTIEDFENTKVDINTSQINLSYTLSYYAIPDQLAIIGGFDIGLDFFSRIRSIEDQGASSPVFLEIDSSSGFQDIKKIIQVADASTALFYYGPTMGLSYTYNDRLMLYAKYTIFLNGYFQDDENTGVSRLDDSKANILRIGLAFKFLPSAKNSRF